MRFVLFILLALGTGTALYFGLTAPLVAPKHRIHDTSAGQVAVARVAGPFAHPWAVAFLPEGDMLVTERGGRLWRLGPDGARAEVAGAPAVKAAGQGGLLDVVAARDFNETREIFLTYSEPAGGESRTAVAVARLSDDGRQLENFRAIFHQQPAVDTSKHYGSRLVEAPDGTLWVTLGERGRGNQAQNPLSHLGKVVRFRRDGSVPRDNPLVTGLGLPEIWSFGHRNPQGAAIDPATGSLWIVEHGAKGGDEINRPEPGRNYGWPVISYGTNYAGTRIGAGTEAEGMEQPLYYWDPSIAPSGMMIYSGRLWPSWRGDIFVGALKFKLISRLARDGDDITGEERLFEGVYGRVRDVREGPAGAIWFLTDEDEGALYRVTPAE
ncbi:MAG: PQQ-dependent sugar dehydrogenase [Alphaproteobacteria bacterium]